jgi:hypothetical protein
MIVCFCKEIINMIMGTIGEIRQLKGKVGTQGMQDKICLIEIKQINKMKEINWFQEMIRLIVIKQI